MTEHEEFPTKCALIVDDNDTMRAFIQKILSREGVFTYQAESAEEALSVLRKCKDKNIQVILIDLSLPGMDGASLCRKVRRANPLYVTVAMTGFSDLFTICECREAGFDDYFSKPVSVSVIRAAVISAFKRARYWDTLAKGSYLERSRRHPNGSGIL